MKPAKIIVSISDFCGHQSAFPILVIVSVTDSTIPDVEISLDTPVINQLSGDDATHA